MDELIVNFISNIIANFDFTFCVIVNVATYLSIKAFTDNSKNVKFTTWQKRLVFISLSILIAVIYKITGSDLKILFNSIIIAPVTWSWILKPICKKLNIDYNNN